MIIVKINETEREWTQIHPDWIHDQVNGRYENSEPVCLKIKIKNNDIDMLLSAGACNISSASGRNPNIYESKLFDIWDKLRVNNLPINSGRVVAFLQKTERLV